MTSPLFSQRLFFSSNRNDIVKTIMKRYFFEKKNVNLRNENKNKNQMFFILSVHRYKKNDKSNPRGHKTYCFMRVLKCFLQKPSHPSSVYVFQVECCSGLFSLTTSESG